MEYGNICMYKVKDSAFLPRNEVNAMADRLHMARAVAPREVSAADAFRRAARDYTEVLMAGKSAFEIRAADRNGVLIRKIIQRRHGRAQTVAKLWLGDGDICYRIPGSVRTDANGMVDRFKELFSLRMQSMGKKQLQKLVTDYLIRYTKAVKVGAYGANYFVPAEYRVQLSPVGAFVREVNQRWPETLSFISLEVTVSDELKAVLCEQLQQEAWECCQALQFLIQNGQPGRTVVAHRLYDAEAIISKLEAYRGICGTAFTDRQCEQVMDKAEIVRQMSQPWLRTVA